MDVNSELSSVNVVYSSLATSGILQHHRRNPAVLIQWIEEHLQNPYPSNGEKQYLANYAGMSQQQLNNWFLNARRNIRKIGYETWKRKHTSYSPRFRKVGSVGIICACRQRVKYNCLFYFHGLAACSI